VKMKVKVSVPTIELQSKYTGQSDTRDRVMVQLDSGAHPPCRVAHTRGYPESTEAEAEFHLFR
jgi:hypothetical protein